MAVPTSRVVTFSEEDYRYGLGPLRIRVDHIDRSNPAHYDGETWYRVEGVQLGHNGAELGCREVLIRARRLPLERGP
jgi:hypothetical protein